MRQLILFLSMLLASQVYGAKLTIPDNFNVISVNDVDQPLRFFEQPTELELVAGNYTLVLAYKELFEGDDDHTTVKSKPFVVLFTLSEQLGQSQTFTLVKPSFDDLRAAKSFAKKPIITIVDQQQQALNIVTQSLTAFNSARSFNQLAQLKHQQENNKNIKQEIAKSDYCQGQQQTSQLEQLKCLWIKTNKAEQAQFIRYVLAENYSLIEK